MNILLMNLGIVYISSLFARMNIKTHRLETNHKKYNYFFIFIAMASLSIVSGFRYNVGTDFHQYAEIYTVFAPDAVILDSEDPGFMFLCKYLNTISPDPQLMFLVTSIIINVCIVWAIKLHSTQFELSVFLYITTFSYYSTMNGVRQWLAAAIIFLGFKFMLERDFKKYLLVVLLAATIHASAVVMIPVYFVVNQETFSKKNATMLVIFMICMVFYEPFIEVLFKILGETKYAHYKDDMLSGGNGVNPIRVAVYLGPLILALMNYKKINPKENKKIDMIFNLCIINTMVWMMSMYNIFFARLTFYFDLYFVLLLPMLTSIGDKKQNRFMYYAMAVAYLAFSCILLQSGDSWIIPYTFKRTLF